MKVVVDLCKMFLEGFPPEVCFAFFNQQEDDSAAIKLASADYQGDRYEVHREPKRLILARNRTGRARYFRPMTAMALLRRCAVAGVIASASI
jgi:hypothetical protein